MDAEDSFLALVRDAQEIVLPGAGPVPTEGPPSGRAESLGGRVEPLAAGSPVAGSSEAGLTPAAWYDAGADCVQLTDGMPAYGG